MRRGGVFLVMLGAFFLTLAPLCRFYIADRVIAVPMDYYQSVTLSSEDSSFFDRAANKVRDGVQLDANMTVRGDVRSGSDKTAVWEAVLEVHRGKDPIALVSYRMAFDRRTGELTGAKGATVDQVAVPQSGYGLVWPVANVQKKTYQFYDVITQRTWPMKYNGTERVQGILAYRYVQQIEPTLVANSKKTIDPRVVGLPKKHKPVKVGRYHSATVTMWVDPRTGMPIKQQQAVDSTLRTADGDEGTFLKADLVLNEKGQKALAKSSEEFADRIALIRTVLPGASMVIGLIMLAIGGVMSLFLSGGGSVRQGRPSGGPAAPARVEPVPVNPPGVIPGSPSNFGAGSQVRN
jgi:hypothetical protein